MKRVSLRTRFAVVAAVAALLLATPLAAQAHEHPDQTENPCGICKVAETGVPALEGRPELPFPRHESKHCARGGSLRRRGAGPDSGGPPRAARLTVGNPGREPFGPVGGL